MDNNLNNLQRVEAGRRLEILGYEKMFVKNTLMKNLL